VFGARTWESEVGESWRAKEMRHSGGEFGGTDWVKSDNRCATLVLEEADAGTQRKKGRVSESSARESRIPEIHRN